MAAALVEGRAKYSVGCFLCPTELLDTLGCSDTRVLVDRCTWTVEHAVYWDFWFHRCTTAMFRMCANSPLSSRVVTKPKQPPGGIPRSRCFTPALPDNNPRHPPLP